MVRFHDWSQHSMTFCQFFMSHDHFHFPGFPFSEGTLTTSLKAVVLLHVYRTLSVFWLFNYSCCKQSILKSYWLNESPICSKLTYLYWEFWDEATVAPSVCQVTVYFCQRQRLGCTLSGLLPQTCTSERPRGVTINVFMFVYPVKVQWYYDLEIPYVFSFAGGYCLPFFRSIQLEDIT